MSKSQRCCCKALAEGKAQAREPKRCRFLKVSNNINQKFSADCAIYSKMRSLLLVRFHERPSVCLSVCAFVCNLQANENANSNASARKKTAIKGNEEFVFIEKELSQAHLCRDSAMLNE